MPGVGGWKTTLLAKERAIFTVYVTFSENGNGQLPTFSLVTFPVLFVKAAFLLDQHQSNPNTITIIHSIHFSRAS